MDQHADQVRRTLELEHAVLQRNNLIACMPVALVVAGVMSRFASFGPLAVATALVVLQLCSGLLAMRWVGLSADGVERPDHLRAVLIGVNLTGGPTWGLFFFSMLPDNAEAQLLLGWVAAAAMLANMIEASPVKASFLAFHLPFSGTITAAYALWADGNARWLAAFLTMLAVYVLFTSRSLRETAWDRASLSAGNAELIDELRSANQRLEIRSNHDQLTGLLNRGALEARLANAINDPVEGFRPWAALFIDLDDFKQINDHLGHAVGDEVIATVADRIRAAIPDHALAGRIGGDEFVIALPATADPDEARRVATDVVEHIGGATSGLDLERPVTASIGIAFGRRGTDEPAEVIRMADLAMYEAKAGGGHRWATADRSTDLPGRESRTGRGTVETEPHRGASRRSEPPRASPPRRGARSVDRPVHR